MPPVSGVLTRFLAWARNGTRAIACSSVRAMGGPFRAGFSAPQAHLRTCGALVTKLPWSLLGRDLLEGVIDVDALRLLRALGQRIPDDAEEDNPKAQDL